MADLPLQDQRIETIRNYLFQQFGQKYHEFANFVKTLPFPPYLMQIVLKEFDNGLVWGKEAFTSPDFGKNFNIPPPQGAPAPGTPPLPPDAPKQSEPLDAA